MPDGRDTGRTKTSGAEGSWLLQYYTSSKGSAEAEPATPETGPPPADLVSAAPGEKYDVTGQVGIGGMKVVHRAHDRNADREVALARLRQEAPHLAQERRFLREARLTAALEHPNIVPVHEIGLDAAGCPYFTMKLLGGENLQDILNHLESRDPVYRKQYPLGRRLEIFQNVCQAIAFAHSRGVVHLDLKPANIQAAKFGEVLVLDWGLAKVLDRDAVAGAGTLVQLPELLREAAVDGTVRGTPGYMAPEQERGEYRALDQRTDVYALGAVLRALVVDKRSSRALRPPAKTPPALEAIMAKAMAAEPRDRYQNVEELARDVRAFLGGFAVSAQNVGLGTLFWLLVKRHKAVSAVIAASLVTIAALLSVFFVKIKQSERQALSTLDQLQKEQAEKIRLGRLATPQLFGHADMLLRSGSNDAALAEFNLIVTLDSKQTESWVRKGLLHLGRQEFDEAVQSFDHVPNFARRPKRDQALRAGEIAEKYEHLALPDGRLSYDDLLQLIADVTSKTNGLSVVLQEITLGQLFQRLNQEVPLDAAHLEFLHDALGFLNPPASNLVWQCRMDRPGRTLEIHGNGVSQLLPLAGLSLRALDLSGTAVLDLRWVRNSGLQSLNLAGTPIANLTPIVGLPLTEINLVNCKSLPLDQLRNFPRLKTVTVSQDRAALVKHLLAQSRLSPAVVGQ